MSVTITSPAHGAHHSLANVNVSGTVSQGNSVSVWLVEPNNQPRPKVTLAVLGTNWSTTLPLGAGDPVGQYKVVAETENSLGYWQHSINLNIQAVKARTGKTKTTTKRKTPAKKKASTRKK